MFRPKETIERELDRMKTPTKDDVEAMITLRILKYHKKLVKDYGLEKTSSESEGGRYYSLHGGSSLAKRSFSTVRRCR